MGICQYVDLCFHASSLPCLHTFWHAIPTSFYIFNVFYFLVSILFCVNPLTTDDECTCHATLAASYQLAQSVLKIGFALASKKGGIGGVGWVSARSAVHMAADWLAVEKPWLALAWPFLFFLTQTGIDKVPLPL